MEKMEAIAAMGDIESTQDSMRARAQHKGADIIYAIWGTIWFIAFMCQHIGKDFNWSAGSVSFQGAGLVWSPLVLIGVVLTFVVARRRGAVKDKNGWKFGLLWPIVFGYFYVWMYLLGPLLNHDRVSSTEGVLHGTAVISTIPMCVYVIAGVMGGEAFIAWIGGAITVLTVVGIYFFHDTFYLWMAFVGGGGLMLAGYISRRKWKNA